MADTDTTIRTALLIGTVPLLVGFAVSEASNLLRVSRDDRRARDKELRARVFTVIRAAQIIASDTASLIGVTVAQHNGDDLPEEQILRLVEELNSAQRDLPARLSEVAVFGPEWLLEPGQEIDQLSGEINGEAMKLRRNLSVATAAALENRVGTLLDLASKLTDLAAERMRPPPRKMPLWWR